MPKVPVGFPCMAEGARSTGNWVLAAMVFAVGMTFIDQTIVSIAIPDIERDLQLSETGIQWVVNAYLLALAATFALGGRLADTLGSRRLVTAGVILFATSSALCGLTPDNSLAEAWLIVFRATQGIGAALMIPAALALVISSYEVSERGQKLAIFFAITGALTSVGPIAGGYLTTIDWRAIFWVNIPIALIALALIAYSKPSDSRTPARLDLTGAILITGGMAFSVLGLQQSSNWGWSSPETIGSLVLGTALIGLFVAHELRSGEPLLRIRIFTDRAFAADNIVLFLLMIGFIPLFFFASTYAQLSLGQSAANAGLYILTFFIGFAIASQIAGRVLDKVGARPAIVVGSAISAVGFYLWAGSLTDLSVSAQTAWIILSGFGMGLVLTPANTDAINRAPKTSYGEATGITQTVRNYGASLGLAILGTILITQNRINLEEKLGTVGLPKAEIDRIASDVVGGGGPRGGPSSGGSGGGEVFEAIQNAYAASTSTVFYVIAGVMAVMFLFALVAVPKGKAPENVPDDSFESPADSGTA